MATSGQKCEEFSYFVDHVRAWPELNWSLQAELMLQSPVRAEQEGMVILIGNPGLPGSFQLFKVLNSSGDAASQPARKVASETVRHAACTGSPKALAALVQNKLKNGVTGLTYDETVSQQSARVFRSADP